MRIKTLPMLSAAVAVSVTGGLAFAAPSIIEATSAPQVAAEERVSYVEPIDTLDLPTGDELSYSTPRAKAVKADEDASAVEVKSSKPIVSSKPAPPKPKPTPKPEPVAVAKPEPTPAPTLPGTKTPFITKAKPATQTPLTQATQRAAPAAPRPTAQPAPAKKTTPASQRAQAKPVVKKKAVAQPKPVAQPQQKPAQAPQVSTVSNVSPKAYAKSKVLARGWSEADYQCLVKLWTKESNWNYKAKNPSSGAYGIPQALPGNKMVTAGSDWMSNPKTQIDWGLGYISQRYGDPCNAWGHSQRVNWY